MAVITNKLTLVLFLAACTTAATLNDVGNAAVFDICNLTDFKETCHKSLAGAHGTKPKDLIKAEIDAATVELQSGIKKVAAFKKTAPSDHLTQSVLADCEQDLNNAVDYLKKSSNIVNEIEIGRLDFNIADVRKWLSGSIDEKEEGCIDLLSESTSGGILEKVTAMLKTSSELMSNSLDMITLIDPRLLKDESHGQAIPPVAAPPQRL